MILLVNDWIQLVNCSPQRCLPSHKYRKFLTINYEINEYTIQYDNNMRGKVLLSVLLEWKRPDLFSIRSGLLSVAPRARLSAKLVWLPFLLLNDSYQEKHTYYKLFYRQGNKKI